MSDSDTPTVTSEQIDEVLDEFGGDHRTAIAALLQDLATLAGDYEGSGSTGYVRSNATPTRAKRA